MLGECPRMNHDTGQSFRTAKSCLIHDTAAKKTHTNGRPFIVFFFLLLLPGMRLLKPHGKRAHVYALRSRSFITPPCTVGVVRACRCGFHCLQNVLFRLFFFIFFLLHTLSLVQPSPMFILSIDCKGCEMQYPAWSVKRGRL